MNNSVDVKVEVFLDLDFPLSFSRRRRTVFERQAIAQTLGDFFSGKVKTAFYPSNSYFAAHFFHESSIGSVNVVDDLRCNQRFPESIWGLGVLVLNERDQFAIELISRMVPIRSTSSTNDIVPERLYSDCYSGGCRKRL